jgi:nitroreductase
MALNTIEQTNFFTVIKERKSIRDYNPEETISNEELTEILEAASNAPSAWNLQHWKFMVFKGADVQKELLPIAYNQQQIVDTSAVVAILGDLEANKNADAVYNPLVEAGMMKQKAKEALLNNINGAYNNEQFRRDAAFNNASLAAMQLMLAAKAKGWDTCAMGGFNVSKFVEEYDVEDRYVPVMLISIGKAARPSHNTPRFPVEKMTEWVK